MKDSHKNTADCCEINIQACSATDCTGLIPSLPQSETEIDSYRELYPYIADIDAGNSLK